jgi:hypothetical protein
MKRIAAVTLGALCLALPATAAAADPQAGRTFVSGSGDDANDCLRANPCASWSGAYDKTLAGGTIVALDADDFGPVTIDKSLTLDGAGERPTHIGVDATAILVANPAAKVVIKGLNLDGGNEIIPNLFHYFGVDVLAARVVRIENCRISDFGRAGIRTAPSNSPSRLSVIDSVISDNAANGLSVSAGTSGTGGTINRVTVRNVRFFGNGASGIGADATGAYGVSVNVFNSQISDNAVDGIRSNGARSKVRISNTDITGNLGQGLRTLNGGSTLSWGNNRIADNVVDGAPTGMLTAK